MKLNYLNYLVEIQDCNNPDMIGRVGEVITQTSGQVVGVEVNTGKYETTYVPCLIRNLSILDQHRQ